jgi:hypothetical protein
MAVDFAADLAFIFNDVMATPATIKNGATVLRTAQVIFDNSLGPLAVFDVEVEAGMQKVRLQTADLAGVILGTHTIVINSITYRITKRDDGDGTGLSTIWLKK